MVAAEPTIQDITNEIQRRLETIDGLHAYAIEPDQPPLPCAFVRVVDWAYGQEFDNVGTTWHFDVWILVSDSPRFGRAQTQLNEYLSPSGGRSIRAAIESGNALQWRVIGGGAYGRVDFAGISALGASVRVEVLT